MSKIFSKNNMLLFLSVLIVAQFVIWGFTVHHQKSTNSLYGQEINNLQQQVVALGNASAYQPVTVSPTDKKIYLPQLSLSLPLTPLGMTLVYSADTAYVTGSHALPHGPLDEAEISTATTVSAQQLQSQFNCSSLVRIEFGTKPNPLNPNELSSGSIHLANGKTLQIYAYHLKACQQEWSFTQANTDAIAALFKQAQSY